MVARGRIPFGLKIAYTVMVAGVAGVYAVEIDLLHFLWLSDVALIGMVVALWRESRRLASLFTVLVLLPEAGWNAGFFFQLWTGQSLLGLTDYMFDPAHPGRLKVCSLFHVVLPPVQLFALHRLRYDGRGLAAALATGTGVLIASFVLTSLDRNLNWVHSIPGAPLELAPAVHLTALIGAFMVLVWIPTHVLCRRLFPA